MVSTFCRIGILLLMCALCSCKEEAVQQEPVAKQSRFSDYDLMQTGVNLEGTAQEKALQWPEYVKFITDFENYDHSINATEILVEDLNAMAETQTESFNSQPILSRIKVLQTRMGVYRSYLDYTSQDLKLRVQKYEDIVQALNELHAQMNWKVNQYDNNKRQLLEDLKADRLADEAAEGEKETQEEEEQGEQEEQIPESRNEPKQF